MPRAQATKRVILSCHPVTRLKYGDAELQVMDECKGSIHKKQGKEVTFINLGEYAVDGFSWQHIDNWLI